MTAIKANLAKIRAHPEWQKSHLLAPYRCVKFEREKKLYFFFVEEIVFTCINFDFYLVDTPCRL
jgi:hypothetical protein